MSLSQLKAKLQPIISQSWSDWRTRTLLVVSAAFAAVIALPASVAWGLHRTPMDSPMLWTNAKDGQTSIRVYETTPGRVVVLPLGDYLENVLAAQMPPDAPMQALEAAAIAARTYAIHAIDQSTSPTTAPGSSTTVAEPATFAQTHGADVTDSGQLDLPWRTVAEQADVFKSRLDFDTARYTTAINATDGIYLTFLQAPILAFTFALSPGRTRDGAALLHRNLPYLASKACPDDSKAVEDVVVTVRSRSAILTDLHLPPHSWQNSLPAISVGPDGFVTTVKWAGQTWTAAAFVASLGLPSADFRVDKLPAGKSGWRITSHGRGLDIGMSLHEATVMASEGKSAQAILHYFYPGSTEATLAIH